MSSKVRAIAAAAAALVLPLSAQAQSQLAPRPTLATVTRASSSPAAAPTTSLAEQLAGPTPTALALPAEWSGARSSRTDSLMSQWDAAFRVTVRRNCFRGEENPAVAMVNMLSLLAQSQAVPAEDRDAVASAVHRAWYDVVNGGGCAAVAAPPYQVIGGLDGFDWLSSPRALHDTRVTRDESGRIVSIEVPAKDYDRDLTRRWLLDGPEGAERLTGAEDIIRLGRRDCVMRMAELATVIAARYPSLVPQRSYHLENATDGGSPCTTLASSSVGSGRWSVEYLNPRTGLVEVAIELRAARDEELDLVVRYPGVGYQ
jgi:hypothetical protein